MPILAAVAVPHPPIIIPQVGKGEEKKIQSTMDAYREAMRFLASFQPDTIVLTSPHSVMYADYFHISPGETAQGDLSRFNAVDTSVSVPYDTTFVESLENICKEQKISAGTLGERDPTLDHATVVPLLFLKDFLDDFKLVRIGLSGQSVAEHYRLGQAISKTADKLGKRVVMIASGDLSHRLKEDGPYGFNAQGPVFDKKIMDCFESTDFLDLMTIQPQVCRAAGECGHRSFVIMAGAFDRRKVISRLLSYEGPFGVGYGVATFEGGEEDEHRNFLDQFLQNEEKECEGRKSQEDPFVRLARLSVETYTMTGNYPKLPSDLPEELLTNKAGVFVSLHEFGHLRGCIGTTEPTQENVALEILANAVSASQRDPRFPPIKSDELPRLEYKVDVLFPPEPIESPKQLDPKLYGVIVENGARRGLLLPDLEGVDTVEQQIAIAKQKAQIAPSEPVHLFRFKVVRHK